MRTVPVRLLIGATLLVAGFGVMTDGSPLRLLDFKERECRNASVAVASACPAGCEARPLGGPADRALPTECHSRLWVATCGNDCDPEEGLIRLPDGRLADAHRLLMELSGPPTPDHEKALEESRAALEPRFDAMFRYDVALEESADLEETKKRLAALPGTVTVEYVLR